MICKLLPVICKCTTIKLMASPPDIRNDHQVVNMPNHIWSGKFRFEAKRSPFLTFILTISLNFIYIGKTYAGQIYLTIIADYWVWYFI